MVHISRHYWGECELSPPVAYQLTSCCMRDSASWVYRSFTDDFFIAVLKVCTALSDRPLGYGADVMWRVPLQVVNYLISALVKQGPLSETSVSVNPCVGKMSLSFFTV